MVRLVSELKTKSPSIPLFLWGGQQLPLRKRGTEGDLSLYPTIKKARTSPLANVLALVIVASPRGVEPLLPG